MKRKHNPLVSLAALLLLITLLVAVCTGRGTTHAEAEVPNRFTFEDAGHGGELRAYVITDNETGVRYLFVDGFQCGSMTVLQPAPTEKGE